jgi:hypothetical protein
MNMKVLPHYMLLIPINNYFSNRLLLFITVNEISVIFTEVNRFVYSFTVVNNNYTVSKYTKMVRYSAKLYDQK